jgi:hypothetical protein
MFEHMAFKGTDTIGTRDYADEKVALAKVEEAYAAYIHERDKPVGRDEAKVKELQKAWKDAVAAADKFSAPYNNEFGQDCGVRGWRRPERLSPITTRPRYHYSLPINRLELVGVSGVGAVSASGNAAVLR